MTTSTPALTQFSHGGGCGCKIAPGLLSEILSRAPRGLMPPELMVGLETSDDAAVYRLNEHQALVATTDFFTPIVDNPRDFGRIAATNALSDIYAMGGTPILALALVGMPIAKLSPETIGEVLAGGAEICREAGIPVAGGHSIDLLEPIYGLVALGLVHPDRVRRNADAQAGYAEMLAHTTRLNRVGSTLGGLAGVHAMTDVTGFGLAGHLLEVCRGSALQAEVRLADLPLIGAAQRFARDGVVTGASARNWASYGGDITWPDSAEAWQQALVSDPQTSGGLLVSCAPEAADAVLSAFHEAGFAEAAVVGRMQTLQADARAGVRFE